MRRSIKIAVAACVLLAVAATAAWATGLGGRFVASDGSITACVRNADGGVRLIDTSIPGRFSPDCKPSETRVTFNQKGQVGPKGPKGDPGQLSDASALTGLACTTSGGDPGNTVLTFAADGASTLYCDTGAGAPAAPAVCGNGSTETGEQCDSGGSDSASCNGYTCQIARCGDGYVNAAAGEQCDTGGSNTSWCVGSTCKVSTCGDGYTNFAAGEQCDSSGSDTASCNGLTCQAAACGDGYVNRAAGEQCDDGNLNGSHDTCSITCQLNPTP